MAECKKLPYTECCVDGCLEITAMKWRFCKKHRYYYERFGFENPPTTLICSSCEQEKPFDEFARNGTYQINVSGLCGECLKEKRKNAQRHKNKKRMEKIKSDPKKYAEYKKKKNKRKSEYIKTNTVARDKKRKRHQTCCINRRARKKGNGGIHTPADIQFLFDSQKGKCICCRKSIKNGYHIDHVIPLALGGGSEKENLQLLCSVCNLQKCAKHPIEFMQEKGFLI